MNPNVSRRHPQWPPEKLPAARQAAGPVNTAGRRAPLFEWLPSQNRGAVSTVFSILHVLKYERALAFRRIASMTLFRFYVSALAIALTLTRALAGQTPTAFVVRGLVFDSLRSQPLPGAFVRLTPAASTQTARTTLADSQGHFQFDSVSQGPYTLSFEHSILDSFGLSGATVHISVDAVDSRSVVMLTTPSFATLWRAACGSQLVPQDSGFIFGTTRTAVGQQVLGGARVHLRWIALRTDSTRPLNDPSRILERGWGATATSDASGGYVICGVPSNQPMRLIAGTDSLTSGLIELSLKHEKWPTFARRDLLLGPIGDSGPLESGTVAGFVTDENGQGIKGARITTSGVAEVRTDTIGRFELRGVPIGTRDIVVFHLGSQPTAATIDVIPNDTALALVTLNKIVELPAMVVTAVTARQRMLAEFEERKALGIGHFMDSTQIGRFNSVANAVSMMGAGCTVFIDGVKYALRDAAMELRTRDPRSIAMIETHAKWDPSAPLQYSVTSNCGVTLIWTKAWLP